MTDYHRCFYSAQVQAIYHPCGCKIGRDHTEQEHLAIARKVSPGT